MCALAVDSTDSPTTATYFPAKLEFLQTGAALASQCSTKYRTGLPVSPFSNGRAAKATYHATRAADARQTLDKDGSTAMQAFVKMIAMGKDKKRDAILNAAYRQFSHYSFRKTSMEDIAQAAGISRASIYSYFQNKDDIFRNVSIQLHDQAERMAEASLARSDNDIAARIEGALIARHGPFQKVATESAYGTEIYDEHHRLCRDIVSDAHNKFLKLLTGALKNAASNKEIDLKSAGLGAKAAAELINFAASGLKQGAKDLASFEQRIKHFVQLFVRGCRA
jgi:AcrR family transcriptional regulator